MTTFPEIKTDRLLLGKIAYKDIPAIVSFAGDDKIAAKTLNIPHPYSEDDAIYWIDQANHGFKYKSQFTFGIHLPQDRTFIGGIGLIINKSFDRAALGYWVAVPYWNKGYMTEAVQAVMKFGFDELGLNKIYATHLISNPASGKVMMKSGMIKEGELKDHYKKGEVYQSVVQYRLTKSEYEQLKSGHKG